MPADPLILMVVAGGALIGATASGLAGFAFAATTLGLYAHFLPPGVVSPLVVSASLAVQLIVLPMIWRRLDWRAAVPFLVGGVVGVPLGAALLSVLSPDTFRHVAGALLLLYAVSVLLAGRLPAGALTFRPPSHAPADTFVAFASRLDIPICAVPSMIAASPVEDPSAAISKSTPGCRAQNSSAKIGTNFAPNVSDPLTANF